jgi:hypothetical protein
MFIRYRSTAVLAVLTTSLLGCSSQYSFGPVEGRITRDGQPLSNFQVVFFPQGPNSGPRSTGFTDEDGHYRLQTDTGIAGAVVGPHRVCVIPPTPQPPEQPEGVRPRPSQQPLPPAKMPVPGKYMRPFETPLSADVGAAPQTLDFEIP